MTTEEAMTKAISLLVALDLPSDVLIQRAGNGVGIHWVAEAALGARRGVGETIEQAVKGLMGDLEDVARSKAQRDGQANARLLEVIEGSTTLVFEPNVGPKGAVLVERAGDIQTIRK